MESQPAHGIEKKVLLNLWGGIAGNPGGEEKVLSVHKTFLPKSVHLCMLFGREIHVP